jgi:diaminopimelate epimerase
MIPVKFCKFHGFGNDYIVILAEHMAGVSSISEFAKRICNRNTGAGSDGIAVLEKLDGAEADYFCEIVNPDGSFAGFSGNGTRCAVAHLYFTGQWSGDSLRLKTRSGVKNYRLIEKIADGQYRFEAEIGSPKFASTEIPVLTAQDLDAVIDLPINIAARIVKTDLDPTGLGKTFDISCVNVGNPVGCIFVDDFEFAWREIGRAMEVHERFPERANIVFVRVIDRENIELRIWERGAGETSASGTCSSGAAVLSAFTDRTGRKVSVHSPGGITEVLWRDDGEMLLTGRADIAYCGEWFESIR